MNTFINQRKRFTYSVIVALAGISMLFTSCLKNNNDDNTPQPDVAALTVVNASPNARSVNFILDNQQVNTYGISYLQGLPYIRVYTGSRKIIFKDNSNGQELVNKNLSFTVNKYYSLFFVGTGVGTDSLTYVVSEDKLVLPTAGSGKVSLRFAHLSPGTATLDIGFEGKTSLFTGRAYKSVSDFQEVDAITGNLIIKNTTSGAVVATLPNTKFEAGKIYTIYAKGFAAATSDSQKVGLQIIDNTNL